MYLPPPKSSRTVTLFPYTTLFRSDQPVEQLPRDGGRQPDLVVRTIGPRASLSLCGRQVCRADQRAVGSDRPGGRRRGEGAALFHRQQEHADRAAALCDRYRAAESAHAIDRKRLDQRREHGWRGEKERRFALEDRSSRDGHT